MYKSETYNWSSTPKDGEVHGTHNVVTIKNGKGEKVQETLNAKGKVIIVIFIDKHLLVLPFYDTSIT